MNTKAKHTPGPWQVGRKVKFMIVARDGLDIIADCSSMDNPGRDVEHANATFIVRACNAHDELVEALTWMVNTSGHDDNDPIVMLSIVEKARAALAKAKG